MYYNKLLTFLYLRTGAVSRPPKGKGKDTKDLEISWSETLAAVAIPLYAERPTNTVTVKVIKCLACICSTQDKVTPGSFVALNDEVSSGYRYNCYALKSHYSLIRPTISCIQVALKKFWRNELRTASPDKYI